MPIVFDKEKNGFKLENPSEEEMRAIESMAVEYITTSIAKMFGLKGMSMGPPRNGEDKEPIVPKDDKGEVQEGENEYDKFDFHFVDPKKH